MELYTKTDKRILQLLSENSRMSTSEIAEKSGCSRAIAAKRLVALQKKLDIRYTLEIDETSLGSSERHIIAMRFTKMPPMKFLVDFFNDDDYVQEAYMLKGAFDIFIYARSDSPINYIRWETHLASTFADYRPILRPSEFVVAHFGFWPLNDSFAENISPIVGLDETDKKMLVLLNRNSRINIAEMAKELGIKKGTARYRLFKLRETGIIKRFTIAVQNPPQPYRIMHFSNYRFNKDVNARMLELRKMYMGMDDEEMPVCGTFQIVAPISGSFRSFALSLFYNERDVKATIPIAHKRIFKKDSIDIRYAEITGVIKGLLPFRNLEIRPNYTPIAWTKPEKSKK